MKIQQRLGKLRFALDECPDRLRVGADNDGTRCFDRFAFPGLTAGAKRR
jgi:hypothetical protein